MNNTNGVWGWVVGIVVVLVLVLGLWWANGGMSATNGSPMASSTPEVATTTTKTQPVVVETRTGTVASVVAGLSGASRFASLFASTGVAATITGKGPYTIFVPTDEAYAASAAAINAMTAAQKKRLVQYHVVSGKMLDVDAVSSGNYTALSKDSLNFNVRTQDKSAFVNSAYVIRQYKASNGVVYLIGGAVLIPPQTGSATTGSTGTPTPR
jgi:uncharacterized surface protein with fasciclin (FAS1) repeats